MNRGVTLVVIIIAVLAGFFAGLTLNRPQYGKTVQFVPGETIHDTIRIPEPYRVEIPRYYRLPTITETVFVNDTLRIVERVDTLQIIRDFVAINHYNFNVFDIDTVGTLNVRQSIQYNRLRTFEYDFTPIFREITLTRQPRWAVTAGVGVGYSPAGINPYVGITFGRVIWAR